MSDRPHLQFVAPLKDRYLVADPTEAVPVVDIRGEHPTFYFGDEEEAQLYADAMNGPA